MKNHLLNSYDTDQGGRNLLFLALVFALFFNGYLLIFKGTYKGTYDAYVHMFFAEKYGKIFGVPWVYNWFEGFDLASYPPLVPQLLAILSKFFNIDNSYIILQIFACLMTVLGAYRFSKIWCNPAIAGWAAVSAAMLTSVAQQVHQFGQLPTCLATGLTLHAAYYFFNWVKYGDGVQLCMTVLYTTMVALSHHLTTFLFAPLVFSVVATNIFFMNPGGNLTRRIFPIRCLIFIVIEAVILILTLYPFLFFVIYELPKQVEIPHATRQNYFENFSLMVNFFLIPLATIGWALLFVPSLIKLESKFWTLIVAIAFTMCLGLGGSTPIPKWFFGKYWSIFTFDRFAAWAAILLLPVAAWSISRIRRSFFRLVLVLIQLSMLLGYIHILSLMKFQPDPVDFESVAEFLDRPAATSYRYLTLGLGSQAAKLSFMTKAPSVDGLYFTARTSKVLRESGIEAIDSAKYFGRKGMAVLDHYLSNPAIYSLKYVIVNDDFYAEILRKHGWNLENGGGGVLKIWTPSIEVPKIPKTFLQRESSLHPFFQFSWGFGVICSGFVIVLELLLIWSQIPSFYRGDDVESTNVSGNM